jgi:hypothetical protein
MLQDAAVLQAALEVVCFLVPGGDTVSDRSCFFSRQADRLHDLRVYVVFGLGSEGRVSATWRSRRVGGRTSRTNLAHLHVFQAILLPYAAQHVLLAALLHLAGEQQLIEDEVGLLEVEDDVELAHVAIVLVHLLDIAMDNLEGDQLIVGGVAAGDEEERGVAAIYDLGVWQIV